MTNNKPEKKRFRNPREFNAPRDLVWNCWTQKNTLRNGEHRRGFSMITKIFDFRVGGENFYCQKSADGHEMWENKIPGNSTNSQNRLHSIFCRRKWKYHFHPMSQTWPLKMLTTIILEEKNNKTTLTLTWTPYESNDEGIATFNGAMDGNE